MKKILLLTVIGLSFLNCSNDDNNDNETQSSCDFETLISAEQYTNAPSDELTINSVELNTNCLEVNISSSGCDGDSWNLELIDSGDVIFQTITVEPSEPSTGGDLAIRRLKLVLENNEECQALITRTFTFDITNLQVENESEVELDFQDTLSSVLYEY